jgi:chromosomal replication initiation ATPase DnaA
VKDIWQQVLDELRPTRVRAGHLTVLERVKFISDRGGVIKLLAPDELSRNQIQLRYKHAINEALAKLGRPGAQIEFVAPTVDDEDEEQEES